MVFGFLPHVECSVKYFFEARPKLKVVGGKQKSEERIYPNTKSTGIYVRTIFADILLRK